MYPDWYRLCNPFKEFKEVTKVTQIVLEIQIFVETFSNQTKNVKMQINCLASNDSTTE